MTLRSRTTARPGARGLGDLGESSCWPAARAAPRARRRASLRGLAEKCSTAGGSEGTLRAGAPEGRAAKRRLRPQLGPLGWEWGPGCQSWPHSLPGGSQAHPG